MSNQNKSQTPKKRTGLSILVLLGGLTCIVIASFYANWNYGFYEESVSYGLDYLERYQDDILRNYLVMSIFLGLTVLHGKFFVKMIKNKPIRRFVVISFWIGDLTLIFVTISFTLFVFWLGFGLASR